MSATETVLIVGRDSRGTLVAEYRSTTGVNGPWSMRYYLTPCCEASAKGGQYGTVCRACYAPIDESYGGEPGQLAETFGDGLTPEQYAARKADIAAYIAAM